jgi:DNA-binding MarR family transcriptional regulator
MRGTMTQKEVDKLFEMYESGETISQIAKVLKVDRASVTYRIKKDNRIGLCVEKKSRTFTLPKREVFLQHLSCQDTTKGKKCYTEYLMADNQRQWKEFLSECERKKENRKQL